MTESVLEKSKMETPKRKRRSDERMTPGSAKRHRGSQRNKNLLLDIHVKVLVLFIAYLLSFLGLYVSQFTGVEVWRARKLYCWTKWIRKIGNSELHTGLLSFWSLNYPVLGGFRGSSKGNQPQESMRVDTNWE